MTCELISVKNFSANSSLPLFTRLKKLFSQFCQFYFSVFELISNEIIDRKINNITWQLGSRDVYASLTRKESPTKAKLNCFCHLSTADSMKSAAGRCCFINHVINQGRSNEYQQLTAYQYQNAVEMKFCYLRISIRPFPFFFVQGNFFSI